MVAKHLLGMGSKDAVTRAGAGTKVRLNGYVIVPTMCACVCVRALMCECVLYVCTALFYSHFYVPRPHIQPPSKAVSEKTSARKTGPYRYVGAKTEGSPYLFVWKGIKQRNVNILHLPVHPRAVPQYLVTCGAMRTLVNPSVNI